MGEDHAVPGAEFAEAYGRVRTLPFGSGLGTIWQCQEHAEHRFGAFVLRVECAPGKGEPVALAVKLRYRVVDGIPAVLFMARVGVAPFAFCQVWLNPCGEDMQLLDVLERQPTMLVELVDSNRVRRVTLSEKAIRQAIRRGKRDLGERAGAAEADFEIAISRWCADYPDERALWEDL